MKVIVCGAGQVGWQIAKHLASEGNDVTVVDSDPDLIARATNTLDVQGVQGFASYPGVLEQAGAKDADMVVAATSSDEVNMVTCQVAHSVFEVSRKIARLRAQSYLDAIYGDLYRRDHLPIDVLISPEREVAEAALRRLSNPITFDTEIFLQGRAQLMGLVIGEDCPVVQTPLRELSDLFSTLRALVVGLRRDGQLFVPKASDEIRVDDECYLFVDQRDTFRIGEIFGKAVKKQERVLIVGGGRVGFFVAQALEKRSNKTRVRVLEGNRETAEHAADKLERTIVLHGDGLDMGLLEEANISQTDAVLAVTNDDKTNMLVAVRAKSEGVPLAISLVNDPTLVPLLGPLNIDAYINPRAITVSSILRHIRHGRIKHAYSVGDAEAEVIEAQVLSSSPIAGKQINEVTWPEGCIVGAVQKQDKIETPTGSTQIEEGDVIVIFALSAVIPEVERLLQVSMDYY